MHLPELLEKPEDAIKSPRRIINGSFPAVKQNFRKVGAMA